MHLPLGSSRRFRPSNFEGGRTRHLRHAEICIASRARTSDVRRCLNQWRQGCNTPVSFASLPRVIVNLDGDRVQVGNGAMKTMDLPTTGRAETYQHIGRPSRAGTHRKSETTNSTDNRRMTNRRKALPTSLGHSRSRRLPTKANRKASGSKENLDTPCALRDRLRRNPCPA